jgi:hypothetical protein
MMARVDALRWLRDDRGSASVEMVTLAIPLFIALIMLASHVTAVSASKIEISHLARTALRAFVTASSTPLGHARVQQVLQSDDAASTQSWALDSDGGGALVGKGRISYFIECRRLPCIQPSNRVRITLEDRLLGTRVAASLTTDQWIQGEPGYLPREDRILGLRDVADLEERIAPFLDAKDVIDQAREILTTLPSR